MTGELLFPIVPRRKILGENFGGFTGKRRGDGSDFFGFRPYEAGSDDPRDIDWEASFESRETIVREFLAEEVLRIILVVDRAPRMALYPEAERLSKPDAVTTAGQTIVDSAVRQRCLVGYLDYANWRKDREVFWRPPNQETEAARVRDRNLSYRRFCAPEENLTMALEHLLGSSRQVPPETLIFLLSDFLVLPSHEILEEAAERLDLVAVAIQDPVLEASFPVWKGRFPVCIPEILPDGSGDLEMLSRADCLKRRQENERRFASIQQTFLNLSCDVIPLLSSDSFAIYDAFLAWSTARRERRRP